MKIRLTFKNNKIKEYSDLGYLIGLDYNSIIKIESDLEILNNLPVKYLKSLLYEIGIDKLESLNRVTKGKFNPRLIQYTKSIFHRNPFEYLTRNQLTNKIIKYIDESKVIDDIRKSKDIYYDEITNHCYYKSILDKILSNDPLEFDKYLYKDKEFTYLGKWDQKYYLVSKDSVELLDSLDNLELIGCTMRYLSNGKIGEYYVNPSNDNLIQVLEVTDKEYRISSLNPYESDDIWISKSVLRSYIKLIKDE